MTTRMIQDVLEAVAGGGTLTHEEQEAATRALAELAAIKKACRVIDNYGVVHSMRFDESKEDDEVNEAADFLSAIGRPEETP